MSAQVAVDKVEPPHERDAPIDFSHIYEGRDFYDDVSGTKLDHGMACKRGALKWSSSNGVVCTRR